MQYTIPDYYKNFKCSADKCEATCCAGWAIVIDSKTLSDYQKTKGPFGNRFKNSINWKERTFLQYDKRCAFLNEENLCDIYTELGHDHFCKTCRTYPRHIEEFEDVREVTLSLSCPEAADLILNASNPVRFLTHETEKVEKAYEDFDFMLFTKLTDIRDTMLSILQNTYVSSPDKNTLSSIAMDSVDVNLSVSTKNIGTSMAMVLSLAHDFQTRINHRHVFDADALIERYTKSSACERFFRQIQPITAQSRYTSMQKMFSILFQLEILDPAWSEKISHWKDSLYSHGEQAYQKAFKKFQISMKSAAGMHASAALNASVDNTLSIADHTEIFTNSWDTMLLQLSVYFISTYFCGAVYDGDCFSKAKLSIVSTMLIQEIAFASWMDAQALTYREFRRCAYQFSRELEHSQENLNLFEEILSSEDTYPLEELLVGILGI